jgi:hypothetical protein
MTNIKSDEKKHAKKVKHIHNMTFSDGSTITPESNYKKMMMPKALPRANKNKF